MRKYKKKELLNCIQTLQEAHAKLSGVTLTVRNEILSQCQEMAIQVGTEIDNHAGEGTKAVSYLEEYCEEVYQAVVAETQSARVQHQKNAENLILQVKQSVSLDIPDSPSEIVFLPYKASMWDALDSIYRAAIADADCNVNVMPIPYFNINSKGEVIAVEYEGNQFPKDIRVTDFRKIELDKLHPDVIFIHNPYDEWNHVTQVPKEYFSSVLVNQTEHLVYIPYFVTKGDKIKDDYCYLPAVRNAWRTFVQSDAVRDCYINNGADPSKIVAMGSPKFDMVLQMQKNPPAIPEEWKCALKGKKVFLLNTHLNAIINAAEQTMNKLRKIFALFREREDVALWWRPHPLSIQTAKSMNSQILEQYLKLIEEFKTLANGVYDDTSDIHRAIALSDAYIGHGSSVVTMYGITGKPIYILAMDDVDNVRIPESEKYLQFACGVIYENELWVAAEDHNGLYRIDLETGQATFVTYFEKEKWYGQELYREAILCDDVIYFVPYAAEYMAVYYLQTGVINYVQFDYGNQKSGMKFTSGLRYHNYLYLFPARTPCIVRYDMESGNTNYIRDCCAELEKKQELYVTFLGGVCVENKIFVVSRKGNYFLELDADNLTYTLHLLKETSAALVDITASGENLYLLTTLGEIIQWNISDGREQMLWKYADYAQPGAEKKYTGEFEDVPYAKIRIKQEQLIIFPCQEQEIVQLCLCDTHKAYHITIPDTYIMWHAGKNRAKGLITSEGTFLVCPTNANCLLKVGGTCNKVEVSEMIIRNERAQYANYSTGFAFVGETPELYEENVWEIEKFVNIIVDSKDGYNEMRKGKFCRAQSGLNANCGQTIWEYVKGII